MLTQIKNRWTGKVLFKCEDPLYRADLRWEDLYKADLRGADLRGANLSGVDLYKADLRGADLRGANLYGADLYGADLSGTYLYGADLREANGVISFGPVGLHKRIGYAVRHKNDVFVQLGCFWGTAAEAVEQIVKKYGEGSSYEAVVQACAASLEKDQSNIADTREGA